MTGDLERRVRRASEEDGAACAEIYAPYVEGSAITFELEPPDAREMSRRIESANRQHEWLLLEGVDGILGYAYGSTFNPRPAYRFSCEVSIYLRTGVRRTGAGRQLYGALLERLAERGYKVALAGMTLPNPASEGLHRALGFEPVGTFRRVGFKQGSWLDVAWMRRELASQDGPPRELGPR